MNDKTDSEYKASVLARVYELLLRKAAEAEAEAKRREQESADDAENNTEGKRPR